MYWLDNTRILFWWQNCKNKFSTALNIVNHEARTCTMLIMNVTAIKFNLFLKHCQDKIRGDPFAYFLSLVPSHIVTNFYMKYQAPFKIPNNKKLAFIISYIITYLIVFATVSSWATKRWKLFVTFAVIIGPGRKQIIQLWMCTFAFVWSQLQSADVITSSMWQWTCGAGWSIREEGFAELESADCAVSGV